MITKNMDMKRLLESADGWARVRDGMLKEIGRAHV